MIKMVCKIISSYHNDRFLGSHRALLYYAHIIAVIHGIGFILQGNTTFDAFLKYAIMNQDAWHSGLPALSVFNMALVIGIFTTALTILSVYIFTIYPRSAWNWLLTLLIFLFGGGFVFFFISTMVHISLMIGKKDQRIKQSLFAEILLIGLLNWVWASWLFGWMFPDVMKRMSMVLFILFDITIPFTILFSLHISRSRDKVSKK